MSFPMEKYVYLAKNGKLNEAIQFRISQTPNMLYKYSSFQDEKGCDKKCCKKRQDLCNRAYEMNEMKLHTLENNKIWMSTFDNLNDPFENKTLYPDRKKLKDAGCSDEFGDEIISGFRKSLIITSLSNVFNNMPMWAHYSNNHNGICLKYDVINARNIYPISYEKRRVKVGAILTDYYHDSFKTSIQANIENNENFFLLFNNANIKHSFWSYEEEYRAIYINSSNVSNGMTIPLDEIGLKINTIYIGLRCSDRCRDRLKKISYRLNCKLSEMYFDEDSSEYTLAERII